jgi:hypothetical protein
MHFKPKAKNTFSSFHIFQKKIYVYIFGCNDSRLYIPLGATLEFFLIITSNKTKCSPAPLGMTLELFLISLEDNSAFP